VPPPAPDPPEPLPVVSAEWLASHHEYLLVPIESGPDGVRTAACPVCVSPVPLPPTGGWINTCCPACGTEFVATDGMTPPPEPVAHSTPEPRTRPGPLAPPPFGPLAPLPDRALSFTSDIHTDVMGRKFVTCPLCLGADVYIPEDASVAAFPRCPSCHGSFLVKLSTTPAPVAAPESVPGAPPPPPIFDPDGRLWHYCPNCGLAALSPERVGRAYVLTCLSCGQRIVVSKGAPPRLAPLPAPPSLWDRIRHWFRGRR
jgi:hypothetical protein